MTSVFKLAAEFTAKVCGMPQPPQPTMLASDRKDWFDTAIQEELNELAVAETVEDQVDAIIDLIYFAAGRLHEMGVADSDACFEAVHVANMQKVQGEQAKRPGSLGHDAVKPEGWEPPNLFPFIYNSCRMVGADRGRVEEMLTPPKILVLGYGRHGKDTVSEMLRDKYGMRFTSSSLFCAERVMMPYFEDYAHKHGILNYENVERCYADRSTKRAEWYEAIRDFNRPDPTALARAILKDNDVYCGMRSKAEFHACRNADLFDFVIWVDRSDEEPPEDRSSCTVEPWMADFVIDNNGSLEDLDFNVRLLMQGLLTS